MPETHAESVVGTITADHYDAHKGWTVQSGEPYPGTDYAPGTKFNPNELPDPEKALLAGLPPVVLPDAVIDTDHVTQGPAGDVDLDHPTRERGRRQAEERDEAIGAWPEANLARFEQAKAQQEGRSIQDADEVEPRGKPGRRRNQQTRRRNQETQPDLTPAE